MDSIAMVAIFYLWFCLLAARLSFVWWDRHHSRRDAWMFSALTFVGPLSVIYELWNWDRRK